jgi:hypothetical protein
MYIQTGADETLLDDSRRLADLARRSGVDVTLEIVPEMQHVFQFLAGTAPEAPLPASKAMKSVPGSVIISADDDNLIRWGQSLSHPIAGGAVGQHHRSGDTRRAAVVAGRKRQGRRAILVEFA